jgi:hypothetical protein
MLDFAQLLRVSQVHPQFDISPDDSKIAFSWNETGEWQIYEIEFLFPNGSPTGVLRKGVRGEGYIQPFLKIENILDSEMKRVEFLAKALENNNTSVIE